MTFLLLDSPFIVCHKNFFLALFNVNMLVFRGSGLVFQRLPETQSEAKITNGFKAKMPSGGRLMIPRAEAFC